VLPSQSAQRILKLSLVLSLFAAFTPNSLSQISPSTAETIILVRHGEKPAAGLGQLTCKGLNRSLALPSLLIGRYGKPDFIYAPNPSVQVNDGHKQPTYSYIRPLATVEPTAIRLGLPVNTQIGSGQTAELEKALLQPAYARSLVFVAWEHYKLHELATQILHDYGSNAAQIPDWPKDDYETIYILHITRTGKNEAPHATFEIQNENLGNSLSDTCPGPQ